MTRKNIEDVASISFWKRHPSDMLKTDSVEFVRKEDDSFVMNSHGEFVRDSSFSEFEKVFSTMFYEYGSMFDKEQYLGYLYENNPENFMLRFSLIIRFKNATYLFYKGIDREEQPHYQDILHFFKPYLLEIDKTSYID